MSSMSERHSKSGDVKELSESVDSLASRIRSLIGGDKISSARRLADVAVRNHPDCEELKLLLESLYPGEVTRRKLPDSSHRNNMEWLTRHQEEHRGKWVALLDGQLVAADADLENVRVALNANGSDRRPLVHHIRD